MADIPRAMLDRYNELVGGVSERVSMVTRTQLATIGTNDPTLLKAAVQRTLLGGDHAVSEVDKQFYQAARRVATGSPGTTPTTYGRSWTDKYVDRAVDAMYRDHGERDENGRWRVTDDDGFADDLAQFVERIINEASKSHISDYGKRDPMRPKYARVPSGAETCAWCWSLAGLGFQYKSAESASHSHAHCDCVVVPSWGGSGVEGYDSEKYAQMFRDARSDLYSGNVPDELLERITKNSLSVSGYNEDWQGVLAVMRWKYGLT